MCVSECGYVYTQSSWSPVELELLVGVSHWMWVLGTKFILSEEQ